MKINNIGTQRATYTAPQAYVHLRSNFEVHILAGSPSEGGDLHNKPGENVENPDGWDAKKNVWAIDDDFEIDL